MISPQKAEKSDPFSPFSSGDAHLECWVQCWAAQCRRGMDLLQVQCRATKVMKELENLHYGEMLRVPGEGKVQGAFIHVDRHLIGEVKVYPGFPQ